MQPAGRAGDERADLFRTQRDDHIDLGEGHLIQAFRAVVRDVDAKGVLQLARELAEEALLPMVIDADGLNALAGDLSLLTRRKSPDIILTPHPGEMARLAGVAAEAVESDRIGTARGFAVKYRVFIVLKGARTVIAAPDGRIALNGSGNPGMASGGMGDVLTGVLVALLGQGYDPFDACKLGVFLHGHAADLVAAEKGEIGMSAVDVQERLPYALKDLMNVPATKLRP